MIPWMLTRMLVRDLWARRTPLAAILLIAALGTACLSAMLGAWLDLDQARERFYSHYRLGDFQVSLKRAPVTVLEGLEGMENLLELEGRVRIAARVELEGLAEPIQATTLSLPEQRDNRLNQVMLVRGHWFDDPSGRQVLLSDAFARAHRLFPGQRLKALILGEQREMVVVGTVKSPEFVYVLPPGGGLVPEPARTGVLFLPLRALQRWAQLEGACNEIVGRVADRSPGALAATLRALEERLEPYGVLQSQPMSEVASVQFLANELQELRTTATVMPAICLGVVALVLNLVMGRLVATQRNQIGTLRALGHPRTVVLLQYLGYGACLGLLGGLLGLGLGAWMQAGMVGLYRQYYELPDIRAGTWPGVALAALGASWLAATLGSLQAALRASRLEPAEAMRPPAPEAGRGVLLERFPGLWARLPFGLKMIVRSILRNPFRSSVTTLTMAISTALMVEGLALVSAVDFMLAHEFEKTSRQDVTVSLRDPVARSVVEELGALAGISRVEPQLQVPCRLTRGTRERKVGVAGLTAEHALYTPLDSQGRPVPIPERGLVLSRKLAELLAVKPGETLILKPLLGRREAREAPVVALADTYVGLAAYARLEYLSRLLGESWAANSLLLELEPRQATPELLRELHRRPQVMGLGTRQRALDHLRATLGRNLGVFLGFMLGFYGSLAFGGVLNSALVALSERQREVGTLRVMGCSTAEVWRVIGGESMLLGGLGIGLGLPAGIGLVHWMVSLYSTELFRFPAVYDARALAWAALTVAACLGLAQSVVYASLRRQRWLEVFKVYS